MIERGNIRFRESGGSEIAAREGASAGHDGGRGIGPSAWQHHHVGTDPHPAIEVLDVLVGQTNAARRNELADGRWLVGAVDAIERVAEIERTRAERNACSSRHHPRLTAVRNYGPQRTTPRPGGTNHDRVLWQTVPDNYHCIPERQRRQQAA